MAVGICNSYHAVSEYLLQWQFLTVHFGIDQLWSRGLPEPYAPEYRIGLKPTPVQTAEELPGWPLVVLAPADGKYIQGVENLIDFQHPESAIYLFGGDDRHLTQADFGRRSPDHVVYIPTKKHVMHSFMAAGIVLYDRVVKASG